VSLDPTNAHSWRPMLLGFIRASVLRGAAEIRRVSRELEDFVTREDFTLGPVFVESGNVPGAFHAMIDELGRNEAVRGLVIPDRRHLSAEEQLILSRHERGSRTPVLTVRSVPLTGGPGAAPPFGSGPAFPFRRRRPRG